MKRVMLRIVFVCAIAFGFGLSVASAGDSSVVGEGFKDFKVPGGIHHRNFFFKLRAGGQIDESSSAITFAGQATFLGQFTATGQFDPSTNGYEGTITTATGDTVNWTLRFETSPQGEMEAHVSFNHGTGDWSQFNGWAIGPAELEPDSMFSLRLEGRVSFWELGF
jgi:hypothetical protein